MTRHDAEEHCAQFGVAVRVRCGEDTCAGRGAGAPEPGRSQEVCINDHLFVPALWNKKEIIAYSGLGYENKSWQLPDDWRDVKSVDLYRITLEGCVPLKQGVGVTDAKLVLSLGKDEAVSIVPAGSKAMQTCCRR